MVRGTGLFCALIVAVLISTAARAEPVEGRDYVRLQAPQPPETKSKIEVLEFFSYGCPHCDHLHPLITAWAAKLPADVTFVRVPVSMGHPQWGQLVRAYYALQATGDLARLDNALFAAIHKEKQPLFNEASLAAWAEKNGVPAQKFRDAFNSFSVGTKASHAEQLARNYRVDGIPLIVVDGRFVVRGNSYEQMITNASQVLELAQKNPR